MSELWIPETARPGFYCRICSKEYSTREQREFEKHMVSCSEENHDRLVSVNAKQKAFDAHIDPEWEAYNAGLRSAGIDPDVQFNRGRKSNIRRAGES